MSEIIDVYAREVLDSRGNPTVEADVILESGAMGRAIVPSGASTGEREALELRDGGTRYLGKGVQQGGYERDRADRSGCHGMDATEQAMIDRTMIDLDGTENKDKARRECHARGFACRRQGSGGGRGPAALPLSRRPECQGTAGPDDERAERRRARGQQCGFPGVHDHPGRRGHAAPRRSRMGAEVFHNLKAVLKKKGLQHRGGRRRRIRPESSVERGGGPGHP